MAAYRRVDGLKSHLRADCLYTEISSGTNARKQVWENFTFTFIKREACYYSRLVLFRSTAGVTSAQLEEAASQLETYLNQRFVHALVRQRYYQPDEVIVLLTAKSKLDKAIKALSDEGCEAGASVGPELTMTERALSDEGCEAGASVGPELTMTEGQPIIVRFRGNISDTDQRPVTEATA